MKKKKVFESSWAREKGIPATRPIERGIPKVKPDITLVKRS